ncbi:flagellin [Rhizobium rhizogenes]|uniref:flagellin n=1 Tax=Rhizobium rhizogenes TaxID=359 RepID=UPI0022C12A81|nr:flagellin [Rhizobium rhizogenes]MCZ7462867.1 flagellin [Rhizobium rhizogenes]
MTSILTNTAAMAAIQTLRSIGNNMEVTQARVSSGLRVGTASDNAAYWSIATTMRSDNMALSAVEDALGLGAAKVDTAYAAMESSVEVVKEIKKKLVAATEEGVDKSKIQEEIKQLQDQLKSISQSASFSGENWLRADISKGPVTESVVGSFIRETGGSVRVQKINYDLDATTVLFDTSTQDIKLGLLDSTAKVEGKRTDVEITVNKPVAVTGEALAAGGAGLTVTAASNIEVYTTSGGDTYIRQNDATGTQVRDASGKDLWVKVKFAVTASAPTSGPDNAAAKSPTAGADYATVAGDAAPFTGPGKFYIQTAPVVEKYNVAATTKAGLEGIDESKQVPVPAATDPNYVNVVIGGTAPASSVATVTYGANHATNPGKTEYYIKLGADDIWVKADAVAQGATPATTLYKNGVKAALTVGSAATDFHYFIDPKNSLAPGKVETDFKVSVTDLDITKLDTLGKQTGFTEKEVLDHMIQFVNDRFEAMTSATADLGSIKMRIGLQEDFISKLTDSIDKGIGRLVDADMNEESTRLKALQTQQQLAIQSLSIANTSSENILSLFRQ